MLWDMISFFIVEKLNMVLIIPYRSIREKMLINFLSGQCKGMRRILG